MGLVDHILSQPRLGFHRIGSMLIAEFEHHAPKLLRKLQVDGDWPVLVNHSKPVEPSVNKKIPILEMERPATRPHHQPLGRGSMR